LSPLTEWGGSSSAEELVRSADHDRYLAALYAPEDRRDALFALYAFNAEVASIRDRISQALPGEIRLQWWRDVIGSDDDEAGAGHPVAEPLMGAIRRYALPRAAFQNYLDARIFDLYDDPMPSRGDLEGYCGETAAAMIQLSAIVLDPVAAPGHAELAGRAGCAQAITGLVRLLPQHRARGQCYIPKDILSATGTTPEEFLSGDGGPAAPSAVAAMIALARDHLTAFERGAPGLPQSLRPAFLPLALTNAHLGKMAGREKALLTETTDIAAWRKNWLMFRRATSGWS
jgi:phytoene synthase